MKTPFDDTRITEGQVMRLHELFPEFSFERLEKLDGRKAGHFISRVYVSNMSMARMREFGKELGLMVKRAETRPPDGQDHV